MTKMRACKTRPTPEELRNDVILQLEASLEDLEAGRIKRVR